MNQILIFLILFSSIVFPQVLREMEVTPTENKGQIPIFTEYPDKAGIYFYTQFDNVQFRSSYGILKIYNKSIGNYILIVEPTNQSIEVSVPGFKTEIIKIYSLQPRQTVYYNVTPKKGEYGLESVSEISVRFQTDPEDAVIAIDSGKPEPVHQQKLSVGNHTIEINKSGFKTYKGSISVSPSNTFFDFKLERIELIPLTISSTPLGADIYIDGLLKGKTRKGLYLFPGNYKLKLSFNEYLPIEQIIQVTEGNNTAENTFNFTLTKIKGFVNFILTTPGTSVRFNNNIITKQTSIELMPGRYPLEADAPGTFTLKDTIEIESGITKNYEVHLTKNTGLLNLTVSPKNAIVKIDSKKVLDFARIELSEGVHSLEVESPTYDSFSKQFAISVNQTTTENVFLKKNTGTVRIETNPKSALVKINNELVDISDPIELTAGTYKIDVESPTYFSESKTITLLVGENQNVSYKLKRKVGELRFTISPLEAECKLIQNGDVFCEWVGLKVISNIPEGSYDLVAKSDGFKTYNEKISIKNGSNDVIDIEMEPGFDKPPVTHYGDLLIWGVLPTGNFASTEYENEKSGFAKPGFGATYEYSEKLFLKKYIRWIISGSYFRTTYDSQSLQTLRASYFRDPETKVSVTPYNIFSLQGGIKLEKEFEYITPYVLATVGGVLILPPTFTENNVVSTGSPIIGFGYSLGLGLRLGDHIYISTRYTVSDSKSDYSALFGNYSMYESIRLIQIGLGYAF